MNFRKFESIENTYIKSNISKIVFNNLNIGQWIVTEKIHGANFAIYISGSDVDFASRNNMLKSTDSFYNSQGLRDRISYDIDKYNIYDLFNGKDFIIYGERIGDHIQKEVKYSMDDDTGLNKSFFEEHYMNHYGCSFIAFDVVIDEKPINKLKARETLGSYFRFSPILKIGGFEDCCKVKNKFKSKISLSNNKELTEAEGVVIEPVEPMFYNNGKRIILKNKTEKFSEKNTGEVTIDTIELNDNDKCVLSESLKYLTKNRLSNVKSKGELTDKQIPFMLVKDIIEEFNKENEKKFKDLCDNYKAVNTELNRKVNNFIRDLKDE